MLRALSHARSAEPAPEPLLEALDSLRVGITIYDDERRLVFANAHMAYIFRQFPPLADLIGLPYADIVRLELPEIAADARPQGEDAFVAARLAQMEQGAWTPQDIRLADGRIVEIKARHHQGGLIVLLWNDVTDARYQFSRLEQAIKLSADAFAFYDAQDRFVTGNDLYAQLAGENLEALKGRRFADIVSQVAQSGKLALDVTPGEWVARRLRGHRSETSADTMQTASGVAYLVRDRATSDGGRAVVFTDITEKTRAETALAQTQTALESTRDEARRQMGYLADLTRRLDSATAQADNAKTMLLRTMSHELKTPLNAILGFSDLMAAMAERLSPEQIREYAGLIHQGGNNLMKMLTQIMDLTKISAGRYELRKTAVDAGTVIWLARESFLPQAQAKRIAIDADGCPAGLMVLADEQVFTGMIHALLDNAVTFTQAEGQVVLWARAAPDSVAITIADNGPGVPAEDLSRILQPFEHAGRMADHARGAGLGLTLVKAFAELHGGTLEIESVSGEGFAATLAFPAAIV